MLKLQCVWSFVIGWFKNNNSALIFGSQQFITLTIYEELRSIHRTRIWYASNYLWNSQTFNHTKISISGEQQSTAHGVNDSPQHEMCTIVHSTKPTHTTKAQNSFPYDLVTLPIGDNFSEVHITQMTNLAVIHNFIFTNGPVPTIY